jgi:hypothetical protein
MICRREDGIMRKTSTGKARGKKNPPKIKIGIPELEHSKAAVLRSLGSPDSRRGYQHAVDQYVACIVLSRDWHLTKPWFCAIGFT